MFKNMWCWINKQRCPPRPTYLRRNLFLRNQWSTSRSFRVKTAVVTMLAGICSVACASSISTKLNDEFKRHFRKYASVDSETNPKMNYSDFLRACGFQPDEFTQNESNPLAQRLFKTINHRGDGLITPEEYISFITLLHSSDAELRLAFLTLNPDDTNIQHQITLPEFRRVIHSKVPGLELEFPPGTLRKFFGKNGEKSIGFIEFCQLLRDVEEAMLRLDFYKYDKQRTGTISAHDFALILALHTDSIPSHIKENIFRFVASRDNPVITFSEFSAFNEIVMHLDIIEDALKNSTESIDKENYVKKLKQKGIVLDPVAVDISFQIFDKDGNGNIKQEEFFQLMKQYKYRVPSSKEITFLSSFLLGTVAAAISCTCVYPLDKIKTRLQSGGGTFFNALRTILKEGPLLLWRGLSPQIAMLGPINAAQLTANDFGHRFFRGSDKNRELTFFETTMSGLGAGVTEVLLCNPQEVVKIRMQMQGPAGIPIESPFKIIRSLGLRGLYKGVVACAFRDLPFNVLYFSIYEFLKRRMAPVDSEIGAHGLLFAGIASGSIASALVTPADTIKTRLQTGQFPYHGIYDCFQDTYKSHGGFRALFRGTVPRILTIGPMFGIQLMVFELLQRFFFPDNTMTAVSGMSISSTVLGKEDIEMYRRQRLEEIERNLEYKYGLK